MNKNNVLFLDEYKKLDDMCKANLNMSEGVAEYVKKMESSEGPKKNVDAWVDDYHSLSKCLHIDSLLADEIMSGKAQCTKEDIAWIKKFRKRISKGEDPILELQKYHEKLRLAEERKKMIEPYFEKATACFVVLAILLLAVADSKNKKKIEEQMKAGKKKKEKKAKKKKAEPAEQDEE
jgi:hypothetical protein